MIKIENTQTVGWEPTVRGMRNPMNSLDKSDSVFARPGCNDLVNISGETIEFGPCENGVADIGPNDLDLMMRLAKAGSVDGKFRQMIGVYVDITAPLYWWKELDTYKVDTVDNPCSTIHNIHAKEFTLGGFSHEHLIGNRDLCWAEDMMAGPECNNPPVDVLNIVIDALNIYLQKYLIATKTEEHTGLPAKDIWWQMIQLLPSSYNQKRTVMLNYEVLANIYRNWRNHELDECQEFCEWIEELPYSKIIKCMSINEP